MATIDTALGELRAAFEEEAQVCVRARLLPLWAAESSFIF